MAPKHILVIAISFYLTNITTSEWIAQHSDLPSTSSKRPEEFTLTLNWRGEESTKGDQPFMNVSLRLIKNKAVNQRIPIFKTDSSGKPYQANLANLQHFDFYHDVNAQASVSLTRHNGGKHYLKGSFLLNNTRFHIDPYHPNIHKRSVEAKEDDIIITKSSETSFGPSEDFRRPEPDSPDDLRNARVQQRVKAKMTAKKSGERVKRQSLPDTTYIVQIYLVVDFYLYETLSEIATDIGWSGNAEDFIAFRMGHLASEIDVRYRNIDAASVDPTYTWTMGTKLSYIHIADTGSDSSWTYPSGSTGYLDSGVGLDAFTSWRSSNAGTLPADADHYMLVTSLDLTSNGATSNAGLAWLSGACGSNPLSINEFTSSTVLAHELGHNLGAGHDQDGNSCLGSDKYVMAPSVGFTDSTNIGNPWKFSTCSIDYFDAYITILNGDDNNCLSNDGSYIASWSEDYTAYIGQTFDADEQCRQEFGDSYSYSYSTTTYLEICQKLWCTADGSSSTAGSAALLYTSCGDGKWCVEEECIVDVNAPALDVNCPFGDSTGQIFSNSALTCATAGAIDCATSSTVVSMCCATCPSHEKPWLGPDCLYGDKHSACPSLNAASCAVNAALCCDSCCDVNGPAAGYSFSIIIISFTRLSFTCNDPALQDTSSRSYQDFYLVVCGSIQTAVIRVISCGIFQISCGSFIVNTTVAVEEKDDDDVTSSAPANTEEFIQQISTITNDPTLVVNDVPVVSDVNECEDPNLNDCSPNAKCTNTDGYYTCTCNKEYSHDLSEYSDELGRVCAKPCSDNSCLADEVCVEEAESEPVCQCSSGKCGGQPTWVYILIGVGSAVVLIVIISVIAVCCCSKKKKISPVA
ncbi:hypothetical protein EB796_005837 [Bugula neritina]|uniref:Uncharacterized protein n=1 Tax=Bugula neritina TaxID=10212 RepID=A0A7J7KC38_BUGNE|nr:hypothetical protein EB796_005837 [Bugula neritina]